MGGLRRLRPPRGLLHLRRPPPLRPPRPPLLPLHHPLPRRLRHQGPPPSPSSPRTLGFSLPRFPPFLPCARARAHHLFWFSRFGQAMGDRTKVIPDFSALRGAGGEGKAGEYWHHEATQTWFDDADQYRMISAMCRLSCSVCDSNKEEEEERTGKAAKAKRKSKIRSVDQLKGHLLDRHGLYMCDLCLEGRKVNYFFFSIHDPT